MSGKGLKRRLIIGIGNEYRRDDGIGIRIAGLAKIEGFDVMTSMGINPELAETLHGYDTVIFVDASVEGEPVAVRRVTPGNSTLPLFHQITCEGILALTEALYHTCPEAWLLSVRGYDFEHGEGFSCQAEENLMHALKVLKQFISQDG
ncbi:MAG TPA: hydrogenase maturation protease [Desulfomonilia bacterium]|nr:hydrogenase maturation protease [Desulfomonilia bacterium]